MNGSRPDAPDPKSDLDAIANELYSLRPDSFAAARDDEVRKARTAGQQGLARELAKLHRPTQSAWVVNLLWRDQRESMEDLIALGPNLMRAQEKTDIKEVLRLTTRRRELEAGLLRRAHVLADDMGVDVTATMEREILETIAAALGRPEAADQVRAGRLVKPLEYAAFGVDAGDAEPEAAAKKPAPVPRKAAPARRGAVKVPEKQETDAAKPSLHAAAERRVAEARAAAEAAAEVLEEEIHALEATEKHRATLRSRVDDLLQELRDVKEQVALADRAVNAANRHRHDAEKALETAARALEHAEQQLGKSAD